jgi:hypothetical protein
MGYQSLKNICDQLEERRYAGFTPASRRRYARFKPPEIMSLWHFVLLPTTVPVDHALSQRTTTPKRRPNYVNFGAARSNTNECQSVVFAVLYRRICRTVHVLFESSSLVMLQHRVQIRTVPYVKRIISSTNAHAATPTNKRFITYNVRNAVTFSLQPDRQ